MGISGLGNFACKNQTMDSKKNPNKCETRKESVGNKIVTKTNAICGSYISKTKKKTSQIHGFFVFHLRGAASQKQSNPIKSRQKSQKKYR